MLFFYQQKISMKRNHIYRYSILAALLLAVTIIACEKQLNKTNPSYPTLDTYFRNSDELLREKSPH